MTCNTIEMCSIWDLTDSFYWQISSACLAIASWLVHYTLDCICNKVLDKLCRCCDRARLDCCTKDVGRFLDTVNNLWSAEDAMTEVLCCQIVVINVILTQPCAETKSFSGQALQLSISIHSDNNSAIRPPWEDVNRVTQVGHKGKRVLSLKDDTHQSQIRSLKCTRGLYTDQKQEC